MNLTRILAAKLEAQRFILKVEAFEMQHAEYMKAKAKAEKPDYHYFSAPKESGAVRRASMDLTRCLAQMRKPN